MSTSTEIITKSDKYPLFIKKNSIFKKVNKIEKIFPKIGLNNFEENCKINNEKFVKITAKNLLASISGIIGFRVDQLENFVSNKKIGIKRKEKYNKCKKLLNEVMINLNKNPDEFILLNNSKITLNIPSDILFNDKIVFKKGEGLFRVYNKLNELLADGKFLKLQEIDTIHNFKQFSSSNIPNKNIKIVFSSDGEKGVWDITTMSMRGIKSCQSWNGDYRDCLIGSILDPFVGIIYIESENSKYEKYGTTMIRRSIVRFVFDKKEKKPFLFIDKMYPERDDASLMFFKEILKEKTKNKFDVFSFLDLGYDKINNSYIPSSPVKNLILEHALSTGIGEDILSYQDTKILEKKLINDDDLMYKIKDFQRDFSLKLRKNIAKSFIDAYYKFNNKVVEKICNKYNLFSTYKNYDNSFLFDNSVCFEHISQQFCHLLINNFSKEKKLIYDIDEYKRKFYYYFLINNSKNKMKFKYIFSQSINFSLGLKNENKLKAPHSTKIIDMIFENIRKYIIYDFKKSFLTKSKKKP